MTPDTWEKVKDIFSMAVALEAGERELTLDRVCGGDARLRAEVEALLRSNDENHGFIEEPVFRVQDAIPSAETSTGRCIGPYRVEREVGRGGMGTVFLARRHDGEFHQEVAIKIVSNSLLSSEALRRFRQERQILARLNHPHIARLLDGGVTDDGMSYLVMEYIEGEPLIEFAEKQGLSLGNRLRLFLKVCRALAYAHSNLIVHRDIKPSNILVTPGGEPKLLDFGLAKIIDLDNDGLRTATNFRALTPAYASPEQLRGETITTASDIYSLGVVLYELVTGARPYDQESVTYEKMMHLVTVSEPVKPSVKADSSFIPGKQKHALRGDIDNIVLMAMRKEPERRYASVDRFASDIERHLSGRPITAAEDTFAYRSTKFVKRHWIGVTSAAVIALVLVAGIATTSWQALRARREKALAEETKAFLTRTLNFSNPLLTGKDSNGTTVTDVLDAAGQRLDDGEFADQPEIRAELEFIIGKAYNAQGKNKLAMPHIEKFVALERSLYGDDDPRTLVALSEWAGSMFIKGDLSPAADTYTRILPLMRSEQKRGNIRAESLGNALNSYACLRRTQGDSKQAEASFREALDLSPLLSIDERRVINGTTRSTLASTLADQGRFDEALQESRRAVEEFKQLGETDQPNYAFALTVLGGFLTDAGNTAEADAALREGLAIIHKFFPPTSLWLGDNLRNQSILAYQQGRYEDALAMATQSLTIYRDNFGPHYDHYPTALMVKGLSLAKLGQTNEGEAEVREALNIRTSSLPPDHYWVALAKSALGECLAIEGRYAEAEPLLTESFENLRVAQGDSNPRTELARRRLVSLYQTWHKTDKVARSVPQARS